MSDKVFSKKLVENAVSKLLPNDVLFALGDKDKVECASVWIRNLQKENQDLRAELEKERAVVDYYAEPNNWLRREMVSRDNTDCFMNDWYMVDHEYEGENYCTELGGKKARDRQRGRE